MILKIKSNNDYLADILYKNPDTDEGLYFKPLRNGYVVGNIVNKNYYEVVFQDEKYSYLPEESNQIDFQSYCSPLAVLHICNELFGHILKSREEFQHKEIVWLGRTQGEADTESCMIEVPSFFIDSNWYRNGRFLLSKYFEGISIQQQTNRIFKLTIRSKSIFEAFNLLSLTALFTHITNDYGIFTFMDNNLAQKFGRILTNLENVPYFVFYLFILKAIKSEKQFAELKPVFEEYLSKQGLEVNLVSQGTTRLRLLHITGLLDPDLPVLDIGCGEFAYYKKMMALGFKMPYYAIDKEARFEALSEHIGRRYEEQNLFFYRSLEEFNSNELLNIILTEVIEHNPKEEATRLIKKALSYNFNKVIITTPNIEFNRFYAMEQKFRHDDHCFEPTGKEFEEMIFDCTGENNRFHTEFFRLGDCIDGVCPVQGVIISKTNK
jgi:hypothetical protein